MRRSLYRFFLMIMAATISLTAVPVAHASALYRIDFEFFYDSGDLAGMAYLKFDAVAFDEWHSILDLPGMTFSGFILPHSDHPIVPDESWTVDRYQPPSQLRIMNNHPYYPVQFDSGESTWTEVDGTVYVSQNPIMELKKENYDDWPNWEWWIFYIKPDYTWDFLTAGWVNEDTWEEHTQGTLWTAEVWFDDPLPPAGSPVPVPSTILLLGSGLLGAAGFRKKYKRKGN